jgi:hypothetical protein
MLFLPNDFLTAKEKQMKDMAIKFGHMLFTLTEAYQTKIQMILKCNYF